jgi:lipopolysaccharide/colanic/teichoic acid biosynthesis glycosyltransferase
MSSNSPVPLRVCYIGGNPNLLKLFREKSDLFELQVFENSLAAINMLKQNTQIDAIISEVYLPGMNGIDVSRVLKSKGMHLLTPYFVVSEQKDDKQREAAFAARVDDFYEAELNADDIYYRIGFLKKNKEYFSSGETENVAFKEYKIPWDKRMFDIVVSSIALLLLSPVIFTVMVLIRLESKGKVYYTSKRVGTGYKIFNFYKLRSMRTGADAALKDLKHLNQYDADSDVIPDADKECPRCALLPEGETCSPALFSEGRKICEYWYTETRKNKASATFIKIKDDPRVTRVGRFIRNTSIDELPQLLNVLKGDMSIVGNRPLPLYEAELLTSDDWSERFMGPAGITGLWQVEKRGRKGKMSEEERKALDNQYARTYSLWGDIKLILRTIPALFQKENV